MTSPSINYIAFAMPMFLVFMVLEYAYARKKKLKYFSLHNTIANLSIGIGERLADVLVSGSFYFVYDYVQKRYGLFQIQSSVLVWGVLFLITDLIWYWYHRLAHELNIFWAVHVVHHQSEDFNYTVSARITVFQAVVRSAFWAILPILGFPAVMISTMLLLHGLYPFFIHTRLIGKLGWLEYVFVTPSHHRVHHASNEKYLDKNYGDVLIIWDKFFGTFKEEEEEPAYGLTKPLNTYSFLWQHFHFIAELVFAMRMRPGFLNKTKILFKGPDSVPSEARYKAERFFNIHQARKNLTPELNSYVVWQMVALLILVFNFILFSAHFSTNIKLLFGGFTLLTLINCGAIMEQKQWIFAVECMRLIALLMLVWPYIRGYQIIVLGVIVGLTILISYYKTAQTRYLKIVYPAQN